MFVIHIAMRSTGNQWPKPSEYGRRIYTSILSTYYCKSFESAYGETRLKVGWVVKEICFLLVDCINIGQNSFL